MARQTTIQPEADENPAVHHGDDNDSAANSGDSLPQVWSAYAENCAKLQQEAARFIGRRLECDAEAIKALASCHDVASAAQVQWDWFRRTSQMYANEMVRLSDITTRMRLPNGQISD